MNDSSRGAELERAILERGHSLADEYRRQREQSRRDILNACAERLHLLEEREVLVGKARAEREFRRRVQASELRMQAKLDRLRWALIEGVMDTMHGRLTGLADEEATYRPVLERLLAQAAAAIEHDDLVATLNHADRRRFGHAWPDIAATAATPGKRVALDEATVAATGGVLVTSRDGGVRVDNTFEGRIQRLESVIHRAVLERLFPSPVQMEALFHG